MDLIILYNKISAGIESLIAKHQIQNSQLKTGDKGQKTKDETYFGVEIRLPRWRGIKGEDTQVENEMVSGVLFPQGTMPEG